MKVESPYGVPLGSIQAMLADLGCACKRDGDDLMVTVGEQETRIAVDGVPGYVPGTVGVCAVVRIVSEIDDELFRIIRKRSPSWLLMANSMAALGAMMEQGEKIVIGSRISVFETENVWSQLHVPMIVGTALWASCAICGGARAAIEKRELQDGTSRWSQEDFDSIAAVMSHISVCNADPTGFTAEFGLEPGATSAVMGHANTALLRMRTDQPHAFLEGGLLVQLRLPHPILESAEIVEVCARLNQLEMAAEDIPPHCGAWCRGPGGMGMAYVSYLPNSLHAVPGVATNIAVWSLHRAQWASKQLRDLGYALTQ
jgi:hypothetical protein